MRAFRSLPWRTVSKLCAHTLLKPFWPNLTVIKAANRLSHWKTLLTASTILLDDPARELVTITFSPLMRLASYLEWLLTLSTEYRRRLLLLIRVPQMGTSGIRYVLVWKYKFSWSCAQHLYSWSRSPWPQKTFPPRHGGKSQISVLFSSEWICTLGISGLSVTFTRLAGRKSTVGGSRL